MIATPYTCLVLLLAGVSASSLRGAIQQHQPIIDAAIATTAAASVGTAPGSTDSADILDTTSWKKFVRVGAVTISDIHAPNSMFDGMPGAITVEATVFNPTPNEIPNITLQRLDTELYLSEQSSQRIATARLANAPVAVKHGSKLIFEMSIDLQGVHDIDMAGFEDLIHRRIPLLWARNGQLKLTVDGSKQEVPFNLGEIDIDGLRNQVRNAKNNYSRDVTAASNKQISNNRNDNLAKVAQSLDGLEHLLHVGKDTDE